MPNLDIGSVIDASARSAAIRRATARFCLTCGWSPLHEVSLPDGRRADILALAPSEAITCIEIKSSARDFIVDQKWPYYRNYCDQLFFAVDPDFPLDLLPGDVGLIVAAADSVAFVRDAPLHRLPPQRRRQLVLRFAHLAALRLAAVEDPVGLAETRASLRAD